MKTKLNHGLTLIDILIVIAIISLFAMITIPNIMQVKKIRNRDKCIANLQKIEEIKKKWYAEHEGPVVMSQTNISEIICPSGGTYILEPVGVRPSCSLVLKGHILN